MPGPWACARQMARCPMPKATVATTRHDIARCWHHIVDNIVSHLVSTSPRAGGQTPGRLVSTGPKARDTGTAPRCAAQGMVTGAMGHWIVPRSAAHCAQR